MVCGHTFHWMCLDTYLAMSGTDKPNLPCPTCKVKASDSGNFAETVLDEDDNGGTLGTPAAGGGLGEAERESGLRLARLAEMAAELLGDATTNTEVAEAAPEAKAKAQSRAKAKARSERRVSFAPTIDGDDDHTRQASPSR